MCLSAVFQLEAHHLMLLCSCSAYQQTVSLPTIPGLQWRPSPMGGWCIVF